MLDNELKASIIRTESGGAGFDGIHFKGFKHRGKVLTSAAELKLSSGGARNVTFAP